MCRIPRICVQQQLQQQKQRQKAALSAMQLLAVMPVLSRAAYSILV
jgi:hypothetical protein